MPDDLITVATYAKVHEAHIAKAFLEQEGVEVFLEGVHTIGLEWELSNLGIGVKLLVHPDNAVLAVELLRCLTPDPGTDDDTSTDDPESDACLHCGAAMPQVLDFCTECGWSYHNTDEPDPADE